LMIRRAARECDAIITVSTALKDSLVMLGVTPAKITVLRNGVDLQLFFPEERSVARQTLGMTRFSLATVANLVELKGHDLVIAALQSLAQTDLFIVGTGPQENRLKALASKLGVAERVRFLGSVSQEQLRTIYSAADALVLASRTEGWPNVLLEAMACGTPVVSANVSGTPEIVRAPEAGVLFHERTPHAIATAVTRLQARMPDRTATRRYAECFSWDATTRGQLELFSRVLDEASTQQRTVYA